MSLRDQIQQSIAQAMKSKETLRLSVLRGIKTAIQLRETEKVRPLPDPEVLQLIHSLVKQRKDSIEQFTRGGRADLVAQEEAELKILESYLPPAVGEEQIRALVAEVITQLQAYSLKDMGRVIKEVMAKLAGQIADGKLISDIVKQKLQ
jgi:uncharacterized protein YqeY